VGGELGRFAGVGVAGIALYLLLLVALATLTVFALAPQAPLAFDSTLLPLLPGRGT
jgi:hypothetical protein